MALEYEDLLAYYAARCPVCKGERRIKDENLGWLVCICQEKATVKWRFEQINITPPELKYKSWHDFKGTLLDDNQQTVGTLDPASAIEARNRGFAYCFGGTDLKLAEDRKANLKIQQRLKDGKNLVIVGAKGSGRSMLAALVIKEVVYASFLFRCALSFKWMKFSELIRAARWDSDKEVDHSFLHNAMIKDFLVIDEIDELRGKTSPPDSAEMDYFFQSRKNARKPTIFVFPVTYYKRCISPLGAEEIERRLGHAFLDQVTSLSNVVVTLRKSREVKDA